VHLICQKKKLAYKLASDSAPKLDIFKPEPVNGPANMFKNMAKVCPVCHSMCSADALKNDNKCHNCSADLSEVKMELITRRFPKKQNRQ
jgi:hypothetical protein